ncbi:MAG: TetR/AcrR family transcriptional regulator [bacterium]
MSDDTKTRILDAAERLFADSGIDATSLRAITAEAGANLAAVNYHFGSKEALVGEVYGRRIDPLNRERIDRLHAALRDAGDGVPSLPAIVEAFVAPAMLAMQDPDAGRTFIRLVGRAHTEASTDVRRIVFTRFQDVALAFQKALARALPQLDRSTVQARFKFMIGAMAYAMTDPTACAGPTERDVRRSLDRLVRFLVGGLEAPTGEEK